MTPSLYPILASLHTIGITPLVGPALAIDLRRLGFGWGVLPVAIVVRYLLPLSHAGFGLVAVTDAVMFNGIAGLRRQAKVSAQMASRYPSHSWGKLLYITLEPRPLG